MKKVVKVSIGNLAFTVEEEGFLLIKGYLDELHDYYDSNVNGDEIIEGIEERMAELFTEKSGFGSVVTTDVIRDVITILGRPDVIVEEQSEYRSDSSGGTRRAVPKRLYRNPENKVLGGVCSGLAAYTSMDVSLIRILCVILFVGFSFLGFLQVGSGSFM
ncbi:MAG: PspC domain-containing protein, partial [Bacteroidales bacterium]|nr:PspC domain-containing protein [Bacteroidales bacterium]